MVWIGGAEGDREQGRAEQRVAAPDQAGQQAEPGARTSTTCQIRIAVEM